mmetsp:Transcript_39030/g.43901  ORF Transcript_39030/g.43901 Transcript_39030/m.43901 type:complete len:784 (-) Transcript_39030:103-2454(-)
MSHSSFLVCNDEEEQEATAAAAATLSDTDDTVRFLFAGQSNMAGHSEDANATQFIDLVKVINEDRYKISSYSSAGEQQLKKTELIRTMKHIIMGGRNVDWESNVNKEAAQYESKTLYDLAGNDKAISVLNNETILLAHPSSTCSFTQPDRTSGTFNLNCERPVTSIACGENGYGPEFMFGHTFPTLDTIYKDKSIGITKVAVGGTLIEQWIDSYDEDFNNNNTDENGCNSITSDYWNSLRNAIHAADGTMEAFVWFQGENDHFNRPYPPCKKISEDTICSNQQNDSTKTYGICETDSDGKFDVCCTPRYEGTDAKGKDAVDAVRTTYSNENLCDITDTTPKSDPPRICPEYTPKEKYLKYLTKLVHDVRTEIFNTMTGKNINTFDSKEQIPVVICELGPWIVNGVAKDEDGGSPIVNAQREFVASDQYAVLVNTGSNSNSKKRFTDFYHFDAASIMIIGDRIANALASLLPSSLSTGPSNSPSESPSSSLSGDPSSSPSLVPSGDDVPTTLSPTLRPPPPVTAFTNAWVGAPRDKSQKAVEKEVLAVVMQTFLTLRRKLTVSGYIGDTTFEVSSNQILCSVIYLEPAETPPNVGVCYVNTIKMISVGGDQQEVDDFIHEIVKAIIDGTFTNRLKFLVVMKLPTELLCENNPTSFTIRNKPGNEGRYKEKKCAWIKKDKPARCNYLLKSGGKGRDECPKACAVCSVAVLCQDRSDFFYKKKETFIKDCDWIGQQNKMSKIRKKCNKQISYTTTIQDYCPVTCAKVGTGPCYFPSTKLSLDPLME